MRNERKQMSDSGRTYVGVMIARRMAEPDALVVPFVPGRDFYVADIQVLLRQALTRASCATDGGLATPAKVLLPVTRGSSGSWSVRPAQVKERRQAAQGCFRGTRRTTQVVPVLVCSRHFCRDFESAGDASLLRLRTANLRWSHGSTCQVWSVIFNTMVAGTTMIDPVAHDQPLGLRYWEHDETATIRPLTTAGLAAGTPQRRNSRRRLWDVGVAEGGLERRDPTLVGGSARQSFTLSALIEITNEDDSAQLHTKVADEQQKREAIRQPFGALVVDVNAGDREEGARRVRRPAELASNNHALDGPRRVPERARDLDRRASEVSRKGVLVEENSAMVLGDHVEVLRQRTVGDETCTLLNADHMPRA